MILVLSKNENEHNEHFEKVFDILRRHKLYIKRSKCQFYRTQIEYFGHVLSDEGVYIDPKKIETVFRWSVRKDKNEVYTFFGVGYLHEKICKEFCQDCSPHDGFVERQI